MSNPVAVKWFDSTMTGAPTITGQAGKIIGVLDACLLADGSGGGFNTVSLSTLVVSSSIATATVNSGHGFTDYTVVKIAGATPSDLNGDKRITSTGSTTFTFDATGISDQTATGTITAKMSPMGWVKSYSGTNKAAYSRSSASSTAMLLRVDDTGTTTATCIVYETMSGIDTGTGLAPTSGSIYLGKSYSADGTTRPWRLYADDLIFYLFIDGSGGQDYQHGLVYGDIASYKPGDAYHTYICGGQSNDASLYVNLVANASNSYLSRSWYQTGAAITSARYSHARCSSYFADGGQEYPCFTDNALHIWPIEVWEVGSRVRGLLPGLYCPVHVANSIADGTVITDVPNIGVVKYQINISGRGFIVNLTGPWR